MAPDPTVILATLETVAERQGDPATLIYRRLFSAHPELERLFHMDRDGGVRASMVQEAFECILDFVGPRRTAPQIISAARLHHQGYGVPDGIFDEFFVAMRDAIRDIMEDDWTPVMETEWRKLLAEFAAIGSS
jgi:hemoglobin-like flavoprotein